jgi:phenylpropionate dioxygenase-like ring-hydroxylating dioxygenase large terminal subunit
MSAKHEFRESHNYERESLDALIAHVKNNTTTRMGSVLVNSTDVFCSEEIAKREFNEIFAKRIHFIGVSSDLPENDSFITVNDGIKEVLAVRDEHGTFKAFINACPHRGAPVALKKSGKIKNNTFVCKFHGWSFNTNGSLKSIAQEAKFGNVSGSCAGLTPLPATERLGLLWVHTEPSGTLDLDDYLGYELTSKLENLEFDQMKNTSIVDYDMKCNWKFGIDGFCESYHFPSLHARTIGAVMHSHTTLFETYNDIHFRTLVASRDIDNLDINNRNNWELSEGALSVYVLFPNTVFIVIAGGCLIAWMIPTPGNPRSHRVRLATYVYTDAIEAELEEIVRREVITTANSELTVPEFSTIADIFNLITIEEDYGLAEKLQIQYDTQVSSVVYGRNESGLHVFYSALRRALGLQPMKVLNED